MQIDPPVLWITTRATIACFAVFQAPWAPVYTFNTVREELLIKSRIIGLAGGSSNCPARSPDLTPLDFFQ